ncbi:MAG TPA: DUF5939 domain-containing protein [Herpetosiphonaceae bacterium]
MLAMALFTRPGGAAAELIRTLETYGVEPDLRQRLGDYLLGAPERELLRFNPAHLAARIGLPRRQGLVVLAAALQAGLIDLNWEVQCPSCKAQSVAFGHLREAQTQYRCEGCRLDYAGHLDEEVQVTFSVSQRLRPLSLAADDEAWREQINLEHPPVSSHELLTIQRFRDLFVNEPLPEGESFQVKWMALMFTDLGGSTGIYARKGDPRAYGLVREHFHLVFEAVAEAGGAVVKTIGDAVMAVFPTSSLAVQAALASQEAVERFNQERGLGPDERLLLKVGLHAGPTLAVTLNDRLDYFGTNVNAAARVQALAQNRETVLTRQVLDDPGVRELVPAAPAGETLTLRGLDDQPFEVFRLGSEAVAHG